MDRFKTPYTCQLLQVLSLWPNANVNGSHCLLLGRSMLVRLRALLVITDGAGLLP